MGRKARRLNNTKNVGEPISEQLPDLAKQDSMLEEVTINVADFVQDYTKKPYYFGLKQITHANYFLPTKGIVLGPVVGLVTNKSARILVQTSINCELICTVRGQQVNTNKPHIPESIKHEAKPNVPVVFEFKNLKSNYKYHIKFNQPYFGLIHSSFTTLPDPSEMINNPIKFAIVSGNEVIFVEEKCYDLAPENLTVRKATHKLETSLWKDLYERILRENIHYVIHIGNNVDIGTRRDTNDGQQNLFKQLSQSGASYDAAYEAISNRYLEVWNEPWTKHVFANSSNIMVMNETDIGNIREVHMNIYNSSDITVSNAAYACYMNYQHNLISNVADTNTNKSFTQLIKLTKGVKLLVFDWRTQPTMVAQGERSTALYDKSSFNNIVKSLSKQDKATNDEIENKGSNASMLIVLSSLHITDKNSYIHYDWFKDQTNDFLSLLFNWKSGGKKNMRQVVLISGATVSSGNVMAHGEIVDKNSNISIKEYVVGPITAKNLFLYKPSSFSNNQYNFTVDYSKICNNYAVLTTGYKLHNTESKAEAEIKNTFLAYSPVAWIEYFSANESKGILNHAYTSSNSSTPLPRLLLDNTIGKLIKFYS